MKMPTREKISIFSDYRIEHLLYELSLNDFKDGVKDLDCGGKPGNNISLMTKSNNSKRPSCVLAEHSKYPEALTFLAIFLAIFLSAHSL